MKTHKVRFIDTETTLLALQGLARPEPGRYRKVHEVTESTETGDTTAEVMVTWANSIVLNKEDILFLMVSTPGPPL